MVRKVQGSDVRASLGAVGVGEVDRASRLFQKRKREVRSFKCGWGIEQGDQYFCVLL